MIMWKQLFAQLIIDVIKDWLSRKDNFSMKIIRQFCQAGSQGEFRELLDSPELKHFIVWRLGEK